MYKEEIKKLRKKVDNIELESEQIMSNDSDYDKITKFEDAVYEIEQEIDEKFNFLSDFHPEEIGKLDKRIKHIKEEHDFYDEEAVLDMMFPNRHDDDFDEDSMSYDSVFGDD
ncbi:MAG: hypothetical protein R6U85_01640 [Salinivirgaceae bacterium]